MTEEMQMPSEAVTLAADAIRELSWATLPRARVSPEEYAEAVLQAIDYCGLLAEIERLKEARDGWMAHAERLEEKLSTGERP